MTTRPSVKKTYRKPELLAPAGDLSRVKTAVRYGADAVYIGGRRFSLRSRSSDFTLAEIREACAYAKDHGAAIHVTVNIVPHNDDFEGLAKYLKDLEDAGVKALIVSSPAVIKLSKTVAPGLEVHCSTQMSLTNTAAIAFLKEELDVDRIVLARECPLDDIISISRQSPVDIEVFIHGGMCVNYSGRCVLSNHMTSRDANRGGCAQSCRWRYGLYEGGHLIRDDFTAGSKDLRAASFIAGLMKGQVASFKIEGRMKTEYYIASTVSAYRKMIDEIYDNQAPLSEERLNHYEKEIAKGENRQTWPGFFDNEKGRDSLIYQKENTDNVSHVFLGTVEKYEDGFVFFRCRNVLKKGEAVEVLSPANDNPVFTADVMMKEDGTVLDECRQPMTLLKIACPAEVNTGDILRRYQL